MNRLILNIVMFFIFSWSIQESIAEELSIKQQILMPGKLIEGHAKWESQCETCHTSFIKEDMTKLCLNCHEDIANDRKEKTGFHGKGKLSANSGCETCHKEHHGRDADIVGSLADNFNHDDTQFALVGAHQSTSCDSCHEKGKNYREADTACVSCHLKNDVHKTALGNQCENCHQSTQWNKRLAFDHSKTNFPLNGAHTEVNCNSCHIDQKYVFEATSCVSCHKSSDIHNGTNGEKCENCHNEISWKEMKFDHNKTGFPLKNSHSALPCQACHKSTSRENENLPLKCNGCHATSDVHLGRNGTACDSCHSTKKWDQVNFDHDLQAHYRLTGQHVNLTCVQCHTGALDDPLPRDCATCHLADDIHKNENMKVCDLCHTTENWRTTNQFDHDLTQFPLLGMHQITACENCHINGQFTAIDRSCSNCHQDVHKNALGNECETCHNPNNWNLWHFDHNTQTQYKLEGKHKNLSCASCHFPDTKAADTPTICGSCHRNDDIHNGEFGSQCGQCHNTTNFFELFIQ